MRYELMLPHQIRDAIAKRLPVVLPLGVLEYHGEHLGVGMDMLAVTRCLDVLEPELPMVILPPFTYGAASTAVAPPEGTGSLPVAAETLLPFAQSLFANLLRVGFRNIHGIIHHQTENFAAGMPTDLAFKFAGRQAIFAHLEKEHGEGFWGREAMAGYYAEQAAGADPFNWIKVHALMSPEDMAGYPFDHAGVGETSLLMALAPEAVDMARWSGETWYTRTAKDASPGFGRQGRDRVIARLRRLLGGPAP